ncbi:MAG: diaminopimelate decarboxylase [Proteobacteria bacterium]|nr:diaminopimelate decarboxylase [Pseudomonadota bacterium]
MSTSPRFPLLRREIGGVPVTDLARDFGTPTYVYLADRVQSRISDLAAFDCVRYAQKANSCLAILDVCRRENTLVDAVSAGEIHRALAAGFAAAGDPPPIVYTADVFDRDSLDLVVQHGIHVNCGSIDMIEQYGARVSGGDITLRVNPGFGHGHSQKTNTGGEQSKHGIWHADLPEAVARARHHGLTVSGMHVHIGSGADMAHLAQVAEATTGFARQVGSSITMVSAGGGLPTPYRNDDAPVDVAGYFRIWDQGRKALEAEFGHPVRLEIEPGRYLVAEAGYLVAEIRAVKRMGQNLFYLLDAGFNNLARPILYGAEHPMSVVPLDGDGAERPLVDVVVGGPLCESGDIFTQEEGGFVRTQRLPEARVGEYVVIEAAGAYAFTMGSNYNSKPLAAEVLVRDEKAHLARARQTPDDLLRGERIPAV